MCGEFHGTARLKKEMLANSNMYQVNTASVHYVYKKGWNDFPKFSLNANP